MPSKKKKTKTKGRPKKSRKTGSTRAKKASRKNQATAAKRTVKKKQARKQSKKSPVSKANPARTRNASTRRTQRLESAAGKEGAQAFTQSGDLEGLSRAEQADSESVDELVEEGNAFEAGAVAGVEEADDEDTREVHTREVPEDDVPEEYLDQD